MIVNDGNFFHRITDWVLDRLGFNTCGCPTKGNTGWACLRPKHHLGHHYSLIGSFSADRNCDICKSFKYYYLNAGKTKIRSVTCRLANPEDESFGVNCPHFSDKRRKK